MTWNEFFQKIKAGATDPVYLFTGPEEWLKREALEQLRALLLPPGLEQLNEMTLEGVGVQQIIDAAETMPMMCDRRMVTVRDWAPLLPGKSKDEEAEAQRLDAWLDNPPDTCVTVFYMRSDPDNRKKAVVALKKKATLVSFEPLNDNDLAKWAGKRLNPHGKKINPKALNTLSFMAGRDLTRLSTELDKLVSYVENRPEITEEDVREIVSASLEYNVFELLNRLLEGNLAEAQKMTNNLLQGGQTTVGIIAMLTRQLRQFAHMRLALDAGETALRVQELLKLHPYAAKQTARQCKILPAAAFKALYEHCVETEYAIKSGRMRDTAALEAILIKIASARLASSRN